jgi:hypothetical protein
MSKTNKPAAEETTPDMRRPEFADVADRIAELMRWRRLTRAEFLRIIKLTSKGHASDVLTGEKRLGLDSALILCERYHVTLDWIYRGDYGSLPLRTELALRSGTPHTD